MVSVITVSSKVSGDCDKEFTYIGSKLSSKISPQVSATMMGDTTKVCLTKFNQNDKINKHIHPFPYKNKHKK